MPTVVVRHFVEALERRDLDAAIQCLDRGVYFVSAGEDADFSAHEGFRRWWEQQIACGSDLHSLQLEALDDQRVFTEMLIGHPESGGDTWSAETMGWVITAGDDVIVAIEMFADAELALQRAKRAIDVLRGDWRLPVN
ncbi:MAG TPA: nuclear transport factor 2 family protein [Solirubrobacterales bacterium]|nr:nuclear transport factor 2 family protein [Solirubrobacterales bacterium]